MKRHLSISASRLARAKQDTQPWNTNSPQPKSGSGLFAVVGDGPLQPRPECWQGAVCSEVAAAKLGALPPPASKARERKPILSSALGWLIFLWCSSSLHSAEPAPEGEKHPLDRKIGFTTEKRTIVGVGKFVWEIQSFDDVSNPARHVGISYGKKLHLPKLPHTDTAPALVIDKVKLSLTLRPPKGAKITSVSIKDAASTKVTAATDYGKPFTTTALSADATTLSNSGEIADAITVNIQHKKAGSEGIGTTSFQIPLVRVDTLSETLALCTKKIHEEGQHQFDLGNKSLGYPHFPGVTPKPGEIPYYFAQNGAPVLISCIGHCLHALRKHGFQKWFGPQADLPITILGGMGDQSAIGYMQTLTTQGWTVYYLASDAKTIEQQAGGQVLKKLQPRTDLLDCAIPGSPGAVALAALCAKPWLLVAQSDGIHVGMSLANKLYEAHNGETGAAIYDSAKATNSFVLSRGFGFIAVPP